MLGIESREFHLGDILSITTGRLVSPRHVEGIYDILNFMTRDNLFTHQLPRACDECKPYLLGQHPQLKEVDASKVGRDNWQEWLAEQVTAFGEHLSVEQIPMDDHAEKDPIDELREMAPGKPIIVIGAP